MILKPHNEAMGGQPLYLLRETHGNSDLPCKLVFLPPATPLVPFPRKLAISCSETGIGDT